LVSDVPVGVWLSGGLDSSTVLHYAAQRHSGPLHTFSITFRGKSFDESGYIREVSRHFGTEHHEFDLNPDADLAEAIEQIAYYSDEPGADAGALPAWYLARMTRNDVTVVLSGEGSDELFGGYLTYKADRWHRFATRFPQWLRRVALTCVRQLPVSDEKIGLDYKLVRFFAGTLLSPDVAHLFWNGTFSELEKQQLLRTCDPSCFAELLEQMEGKHLNRYLDFDQRFYLPDDILYKVDRMSMAHSLEVRPPFLDSRIVEYSRRLPEHFKLNGSTSKYVLRSLMKQRLPSSVLSRPKIGFDIPIHEWFRGVLRPLLLETLSRENVEASGLFDWQVVRRLVKDHLERRANVGYHLWGLVVLLIWMKRWKIEVGRREEGAALLPIEIPDVVGSL
jgi:asparagine synthase (glutamine-hydrolysing)